MMKTKQNRKSLPFVGLHIHCWHLVLQVSSGNSLIGVGTVLPAIFHESHRNLGKKTSVKESCKNPKVDHIFLYI